MRDILDELKARRAAVIGIYADAMHRFEVENERLLRERREAVDKFEADKATIDAMIVMEEQRIAGEGGNQAPPPEPVVSLRDFLMAKIQANGPIDPEGLRSAITAAGYRQSGRAFNMTLQNIAAGGRVQKLDDGRYASVGLPRNLFQQKETPMTTQ